MSIRVYTTPTEHLDVPLLIADKRIYVSFKFEDGELTFVSPDITVTESQGHTLIDVPLTQEQTAMFKVGETISVQVNWYDDGERGATDPSYIKVTDNLLKEIIRS